MMEGFQISYCYLGFLTGYRAFLRFVRMQLPWQGFNFRPHAKQLNGTATEVIKSVIYCALKTFFHFAPSEMQRPWLGIEHTSLCPPAGEIIQQYCINKVRLHSIQKAQNA